MAGVERAKKALWSLLRSYNARGSAKLTVTTAKGKLTSGVSGNDIWEFGNGNGNG